MKMAREIKFELNGKSKKSIELLKYINSYHKTLIEQQGATIDDYDFYSIIKRDGEDGIVACWNTGSDLSNVSVYVVKFL